MPVSMPSSAAITGCNAESQRLLRAGDREQPEAERVEHPHRIAQPLDRVIPDERDEAGERRRREVAPVDERRRRHGADQQVAQDAARQLPWRRQHEHAEKIEALPHGRRGAGQCEDEDADEVED